MCAETLKKFNLFSNFQIPKKHTTNHFENEDFYLYSK